MQLCAVTGQPCSLPTLPSGYGLHCPPTGEACLLSQLCCTGCRCLLLCLPAPWLLADAISDEDFPDDISELSRALEALEGEALAGSSPGGGVLEGC